MECLNLDDLGMDWFLFMNSLLISDLDKFPACTSPACVSTSRSFTTMDKIVTIKVSCCRRVGNTSGNRTLGTKEKPENGTWDDLSSRSYL